MAAPVSSLDLRTPTGRDIPIEERPAKEVTEVFGRRIAPKNTPVRHPAFDVTPAEFIAAIITEKGVAKPPYSVSLRELANSVNLAVI